MRIFSSSPPVTTTPLRSTPATTTGIFSSSLFLTRKTILSYLRALKLTPGLAFTPQPRCASRGSIERWWEIIFSAYLLVTLSAESFKLDSTEADANECGLDAPFGRHQQWEAGTTWKSALNNLRLLLQPYLCWSALAQWLEVFAIPGLKRGLFKLMHKINRFGIGLPH